MSFLFVDRIISMVPGKSIRGIKHVTWDDAYLVPDENGAAAFASSFVGETLGQLAAWNVMSFYDFKYRPVAGIASSVRVYRQARPGDTILLESMIDELDETAVRYRSTASVGQDKIFTIDGSIGPLLPMTQFIDEAVVRQQFAEIYRPIDGQNALPDELDVAVQSNSSHSLPLVSPEISFNSATYFDFAEVIEPRQYWRATKLVTRAAAYFADHFPKNPVLPMTVLLQCKINVAQQFIAQLGTHATFVVDELRRIKMSEFVHPGDVVVTHFKLKSQTDDELVINCRSEVGGRRVCVVDIVFKGNNAGKSKE